MDRWKLARPFIRRARQVAPALAVLTITLLGHPSHAQIPGGNPATGGGMWWGTLEQAGQADRDAFCLIIESGELICIVQDHALDTSSLVSPSEVMHGTLLVSPSGQASGTGVTYATPGNVLADGVSTVADFTITGVSFSSASTLIALSFRTLGADATFYGFYDTYYRTGGSAFLGMVTGTYGYELYGDPASITIDPNGVLSVQTASGCSGAGTVTSVNPAQAAGDGGINAYKIDLTLTHCATLDGTYAGLGTLTDFSWVNGSNELTFAIFSPTAVIALLGTQGYFDLQCNDGVDNDHDGAADLADLGCQTPADTTETDARLVCDDGRDNDGDGMVDRADNGCASGTDDSELRAGFACDDGIDNDGDGRVDLGDPACAYPAWPTERSQCQDGIDNDNDGRVDFDRGLSARGAPVSRKLDKQCNGKPWRNNERKR